MSDNTKIEWADATVNAVNGCSVTSPGCTNCYAMRLAGTRMKHHPSREGLTVESKAGPVWNGKVRLSESQLLQPLKWKRPRRIFWNAHGDLFHENVPDEWIDRVFAVCALTQQHTHMILTKRSARMRSYMQSRLLGADLPRHMILAAMDAISREPWPSLYWPPRNVWLGVSVEDQTRADERIPDLLATPAAVRFISCEPLLGPLDFEIPENEAERIVRSRIETSSGVRQPRQSYLKNLDWVICGGESGPNARPMHPAWARSVRDQCAAAGVPFHFKQWGEWLPAGDLGLMEPLSAQRHRFSDGKTMVRGGKKRAGRTLDGVTHDGLPA